MTKFYHLRHYRTKGNRKDGFWVSEKIDGGIVRIDCASKKGPSKDELSMAVEIEDLSWKRDTEGTWWSTTKAGLATKGMPICELAEISAPAAFAPAAPSLRGKIWKWMTRGERHIWGT